MKKRYRLLAILLIVLLAGVWVLWGNCSVEVSRITITSDDLPEIFDGLRIAQVSDLHNGEFGAENARLLEKLSGAEPDIILITGDLIDSRNTDIQTALTFAEAAVDIAPVYYVTGNHEARIAEYESLRSGLEKAGVVILDDRKATLERDGETVTLAGVNDPGFRADGMLSDDEVTRSALDGILDGFEGYTILLAHRPELFDVYAAAGIDLVFSGHAHGGQFRLQLIGGLIAPNQGLLPEYDAGLFTQGATNMIVSRGLGASIIPVRINNRPELVVVELRAASSDAE